MVDLLCSCGAVNTVEDIVIPRCELNAVPFHGTSVSIVVPNVPATRCNACGVVGIDGKADGAVRWALIDAGYLDIDEVYSHCLEHIRRAVASGGQHDNGADELSV